MIKENDKRITFFIGALPQGGAERVISILSRRLSGRSFDVQLVLLFDRDIFYEIDPKVRVTVVEKETGSKNMLKNLLWVRNYFKKNAGIVVSFLAQSNMFALAAHAGLRSKIVVADRNDPRHMPRQKIIRILRDIMYRFADGVVVQTTRNYNYFPNPVRKKSMIIANPIDLGDMAGKALCAEKRKEIVSVGRLMPQKNQEMLLTAFAALKDEFPEHTLTIYGEGPARAALEKKAEALGIGGRVFLPGSVTDVHERIINSALFVLTSDFEGMPNALIEAMCLGLPCISTDVSGASDLIIPGENGEIVGVGDTRALEESMRRLLKDPSLRAKYAEKAVELNTALHVDVILKKWIDYLGGICR